MSANSQLSINAPGHGRVSDREFRPTSFMRTQLIAWPLYMLADYLNQFSYVHHNYHGPFVPIIIINGFLGLAFSTLLHPLYLRLVKLPPLKMIPVALGACIAMALCWTLSKNVIYSQLRGDLWDDVHFTVYLIGLLNSVFIFSCWSGVWFAIRYAREHQRDREKMAKLRADTQQAKLRMLRYQINPHFLFNTLNSISCLIRERNNDAADEMVAGLSDLLRHSLDSSPMDMVYLYQELATTEQYLKIEKIRFCDRLDISICTEPKYSHHLVPSLILQPLVENAIKHEISKNRRGGKIDIAISYRGERLLLEVRNSCETYPPRRQDGVGLKNIRSRLESLYGTNFSFTSEPAANGIYRAAIEIPIDNGDMAEWTTC